MKKLGNKYVTGLTWNQGVLSYNIPSLSRKKYYYIRVEV